MMCSIAHLECACRPLLEYNEDNGTVAEEMRRKHDVPYTSGHASYLREVSRVEADDESTAHASPFGVPPVPFRTMAAQVMYPTRGLDPTRLTSTMQDDVLSAPASKKSGLTSLEDDFLCLLEPSSSPSEAWRRLV